MRRFFIFALLGPLLGGMVLTTIIAPLISWLRGYGFDLNFQAPISAVIILPASMIFGIIPALVAAFADWCLRSRSHRWIYVGLLGAVLGYPALKDNLILPAIYGWWPLIGGLLGGIPGAVCSWLSNRGKRSLSASSRGQSAI